MTNMYCDNEIVFVELSCVYSLLKAKLNFIEVLEFTARHKLNKILINTTNIENITKSKLEAIDYGKFVAEQISSLRTNRILKKTKIAYIYSKRNLETLNTIALYATNIGLKTRTFIDQEQALYWFAE